MGKPSSSFKIDIIESIFNERWDEQGKTLTNPRVTLNDVSRAIAAYNTSHPDQKNPKSTRNPANFYKDIIRNRAIANRIWPRSVLARGYTGRQLTGGNNCFEFVPSTLGQTEAFHKIPDPPQGMKPIQIASVSMPLASRRLGRKDESWLIQVAVKLRVIETHLALFSKLKVIQVDHLQTNVKLQRTEIDSIFLAIADLPDGGTREIIICCESKSIKEDIIREQIISQVKALFSMTSVTQDVAIPMAVKTVKKSTIRVVEFESVERSVAENLSELKISSDAIYELVPPVPGI